MYRLSVSFILFILACSGGAPPPNSACAMYRELDGASTCEPLKQNAGSGSSIDTAIVHYISGGGSGSKWCKATIEARPLDCTILRPSPGDLQQQQQAELDAAKAKAAEGSPPAARLGPPFAPVAPSRP